MTSRWFATALVVLLGLIQPAAAEDFAPEAAASQAAKGEDTRRQELTTAFSEGLKASVRGNADVPLLAQAKLHMPEGYLFVPQPQAGRIMRALGNTASPALTGLICRRAKSEAG